jgi:hypothetical protein
MGSPIVTRGGLKLRVRIRQHSEKSVIIHLS